MTTAAAGPVEERVPGTLRSFVVKKHRHGPGTYGLVIEEMEAEVDQQCRNRGWDRVGDLTIWSNPTLTMALATTYVTEP